MLSSTMYLLYHSLIICLYVTSTTHAPVFVTPYVTPFIYPYVSTLTPMPLWICPHLPPTSALYFFPAYTPQGSMLLAQNTNSPINFPVYLSNLPPRVSPFTYPYISPVTYRLSHVSYANPDYILAYNLYSTDHRATPPNFVPGSGINGLIIACKFLNCFMSLRTRSIILFQFVRT